jgi:hypothetical protein
MAKPFYPWELIWYDAFESKTSGGATVSNSGKFRERAVRERILPCQVFLVILVGLLLLRPQLALAIPVGTFIKVEGEVEVLRQGKPPAQATRVAYGVEKGDLVRTKTGARAQLRFVDDSLLTLAPGSSVLIEEYLYDGSRGVRQAALNLLRGLAYTVVNRILKTEEPDFLVKTHTAVLGVRGTRFFTLAALKFVGGYNEAGQVEMVSRVTGQRALLMGMEFAIAPVSQALSPVQRLTAADLELLKLWLIQGVPVNVLTGEPPFISLKALPGQKLPSLDLPKEVPDGLFVPPTPKSKNPL